MARILLIMPKLPQPMATPYIGQQYVASSLLAAGHDVRVLDMAATGFSGDDDDAVKFVETWGPDIVGMTLFTYNALSAYSLVKRLTGKTQMLVAGGPHATALPQEPIEYGFDVVLTGEGELKAVSLAEVVEGKSELADVAQAHFVGGRGPKGGAITDLDSLPYPHLASVCHEKEHFPPEAQLISGGLISSRGCPAQCTFCANVVTGRTYRARSVRSVVDEMATLRSDHGVRHFSFWDDAFTAGKRRLLALCDSISNDSRLHGTTWTCITPGNMVTPSALAKMRQAGCVAINFGIESGDLNILRSIKKGQRPDHILDAVSAAKNEGMLTIVNFMFGFPGEGVDELNHTLDLMVRLTDATDFFNNRGVLVPFPGTPIYNQWSEEHELNGWWLDPEKVPPEPNLHEMNAEEAQQFLESDPTLDIDFFHYTDAVRAKIAECVLFKARHNQCTIARASADPSCLTDS